MALRSIAGGIRGGFAFLTRVPVGTTERDWDRFRSFPAAFPLVAYPIGAIVALPFLAPGVPAPIAAFGYVIVLLALVGIPHLDGVADVGDAMAAHGPDAARRALKDTETGVGAIVAVAAVIGGLGLGGLALAGLPARAAVGVIIAAEVGAKLGMATVACLGTAAHEGLGSSFTERADAGLVVGPMLVALPAVLLVVPATAIAVAVGPPVALALLRWARGAIGGVNGDIFGATNELGRVLALHVGVIAWTLS
jgi:adenosylcobinamide-GDP ribazoletransferase